MMHSLATLIRYRFKAFRKTVSASNWVRFVVVFSFVVLGLGIALGLFRFFSHTFPYLLSEPHSGPVIIKYIIELSLVIVLFLGVASFVISSISLLFRDRALGQLLVLPIHPESVFWYRFLGLSAISAWPVFLVAVPALLALGTVLGANLQYYLSMIPVLLLFVVLISVSGGVLSFLTAVIFKKVPLILAYIAEAVIFLFLAVAGVRQVINKEIFTVLGAITPQAAEAAELRLRDLFSNLPSHPFASAMLSVFPGQIGGMHSLLWITAVIIFLVLALKFLAGKIYLRLWQDYSKGHFLARQVDAVDDRPKTLGTFPGIMKWGHSYLLEKNAITFLRNPDALSRAVFLLILLMLYVFAIHAVAGVDFLGGSRTMPGIVAFAFAAMSYFTVTFGMRFAFPDMSLEGRGAWVIWASPLHAHEALTWKTLYWSGLFLVIMEATAISVTLLLGLPLILTIFILYAVACTVMTVTAITLCQGTISVSFDNPDPDSMSTSPAGLLTVGFSLLYIWIVSSYVLSFTNKILNHNIVDILAVAGIFVVSIMISITYQFLARRSLQNLEMTR